MELKENRSHGFQLATVFRALSLPIVDIFFSILIFRTVTTELRVDNAPALL